MAACESNHWAPSVFLDKAQELRRRLSVWHVHDLSVSVWVPTFLELQEAIRWTFRDVVLKGEHGQRPEPGLQVFSGLVSKEHAAEGIVGSAFRNLSSDVDKDLTQWLLRDFVEHLPDAGGSDRAGYLKLKVDRILDAPIYCKRQPEGDAEQYLLQKMDRDGNEGPHSLIGGHPIAPALLDEFIMAAESLADAAHLTSVGEAEAAVEAAAANEALPRADEQQSEPAKPTVENANPPAPNQYCLSWRDILDTLDLDNNDDNRNKVRGLHGLHDSPITLGSKGCQPKVNKAKLIEWWNSLERRFQEVAERDRNREATVAADHNYGRDGVVVPEITGSVNRRRTGTSQKVPKGPKTSD
jgi:hypothetical protein